MLSNGFDKKMCELVYQVHEGDKIRIDSFSDPYEHGYVGREGIVQHIDDMGQLHGTWGGLALIPGTDHFSVLEHHEVAGKVYLFSVFGMDNDRVHIFAGNSDRANAIFSENYPKDIILDTKLVREATREEYQEIENTGAPHPKRVR